MNRAGGTWLTKSPNGMVLPPVVVLLRAVQTCGDDAGERGDHADDRGEVGFLLEAGCGGDNVGSDVPGRSDQKEGDAVAQRCRRRAGYCSATLRARHAGRP